MKTTNFYALKQQYFMGEPLKDGRYWKKISYLKYLKLNLQGYQVKKVKS